MMNNTCTNIAMDHVRKSVTYTASSFLIHSMPMDIESLYNAIICDGNKKYKLDFDF